jgi:transposase, IS5 family
MTQVILHFRKRIGNNGVEKIFSQLVSIHGKKVFCTRVNSDTTVHENNTTYRTDSNLARKIIEKCAKISNTENIKQRQSYARVSKQLLKDTYNSEHQKRKKKAKRSQKKLKTIAGRVIRELERKLPESAYADYKEQLELFKKNLEQKRTDKNKIYSIHKPFTSCIAKGKAHKKNEYGNKTGLVINPKESVIFGIETFEGNPHDSNTIDPLLDQIENNFEYLPEEVVYDRGGRGITFIKGVKISTPNKPKKTDTQYQISKERQKFRSRAGIEPVIGHLKSEFRMAQNYLQGMNSP